MLYVVYGECMLNEEAIRVINEILKHGGSVEIRKRKTEIVIVEIKGKIKYKISADA